MRPRRERRRAGCDAALLRRKPRHGPGNRALAAARRLRHGPVGWREQCRRDLHCCARVAQDGRMNKPTQLVANSMLSVRAQFPAVGNWHYLDSAATAQKPQAVIDAITHAYSRDYATVHRGVYE